MDQFSFAQLEASPLINELVKRLIRLETNSAEIKRGLDEVNRKVDLLLDQSSANRAPEYCDAFVTGNIATWNGPSPYLTPAPYQYPLNPIAPDPNQMLTQPASDDGFGRSGMCSLVA